MKQRLFSLLPHAMIIFAFLLVIILQGISVIDARVTSQKKPSTHKIRRMSRDERQNHLDSLNDFLNHPRLLNPDVINHAAGRSSHSLDYTDPHGRRAKIKYEIELSGDHIFRDLKDLQMLNVTESSDGNALWMMFHDESSAQAAYMNLSTSLLQKNLILVGGHEWNLTYSFAEKHKRPHPLLAEVTKLYSIDDPATPNALHSMRCDVKHVPLQTAFKYADINVELKLHKEDHDLYKIHNHDRRVRSNDKAPEEIKMKRRVLHSTPVTSMKTSPFIPDDVIPRSLSEKIVGRHRTPHRRRLFFSSVSNFVSRGWKKIKSVANDAKEVIKSAAEVVTTVVSGDFDHSESRTMTMISYNYDPETDAAEEEIDIAELFGLDNSLVNLICTDCNAHADVTLYMSVRIEDFTLEFAECYVQGSAYVTLEVEGTMETISVDDTIQVFEWVSPLVTVTLGVIPVTFQFRTPVSLFYEAEVEYEAKFTTSFWSEASLKVGFRYDITRSNNMQTIADTDFSYDGEQPSIEDICEGTASATIGVFPVVQVVVSFLGGPNAALKGYIEGIASLPDNSLTFSAGFEGSVGAQLKVSIGSVDLIDQEFGPYGVIKGSKDLYSSNIFNNDFAICSSGGDDDDAGDDGGSSGTCPSTCYDNDCNHWYGEGYTCEELEETYGCDCSGCSACSSTDDDAGDDDGSSGTCLSTCGGNNCHFWQGEGYTCEYMESVFGCDCSGCSCDGSFRSLIYHDSRGGILQHKSDMKVSSTNSWDVPGQVWFGTQTKLQECAGYPEKSQLTAQLVNSDRFSFIWIYMSQFITRDFGDAEDGYAAQTQSAYIISYYAGSGINAIIQPCNSATCDSEVPGWDDVDHTESTINGLNFPSLYGSFKGDTMEWYDVEGCIEIKMYTAEAVETSTQIPTFQPTTLEPSPLPTTTSSPSFPPSLLSPSLQPSTLEPSLLPTTDTPSLNPSTTSPSLEPTSPEPSPLPTTSIPSSAPSVLPTILPTTILPTCSPSTVIPTTILPTTSSPTTSSPTISPTEPPKLTLQSSITIDGSTSPDLSDEAQEAIALSVATSQGLTREEVVFEGYSVLNGTDTRKLRVELRRVKPLEGTYKILAVVRTVVLLLQTNFTDAEEAFNYFSNKLEESIERGNFTNSLREEALNIDVEELQQAAAVEILSVILTDEPTFAPTEKSDAEEDSSSGSSDKSSSGSKVLGITLKGTNFYIALGVLVVAAAIFFAAGAGMMRYFQSVSSYDEEKLDSKSNKEPDFVGYNDSAAHNSVPFQENPTFQRQRISSSQILRSAREGSRRSSLEVDVYILPSSRQARASMLPATCAPARENASTRHMNDETISPRDHQLPSANEGIGKAEEKSPEINDRETSIIGSSEWVEKFSTKYNRPYWKHTVTKEFSWKRPDALAK